MYISYYTLKYTATLCLALWRAVCDNRGMLDTLPRQPKTEEPTEPLSIRMPKGLLAELRELARKEDRTLTAQIVRMLRQGLGRDED